MKLKIIQYTFKILLDLKLNKYWDKLIHNYWDSKIKKKYPKKNQIKKRLNRILMIIIEWGFSQRNISKLKIRRIIKITFKVYLLNRLMREYQEKNCISPKKFSKRKFLQGTNCSGSIRLRFVIHMSIHSGISDMFDFKLFYNLQMLVQKIFNCHFW